MISMYLYLCVCGGRVGFGGGRRVAVVVVGGIITCFQAQESEVVLQRCAAETEITNLSPYPSITRCVTLRVIFPFQSCNNPDDVVYFSFFFFCCRRRLYNDTCN